MVQLLVLVIHSTAMLGLLFAVSMQARYIHTHLSLPHLGLLLKYDTLYSWSALIALVSGIVIWLLGKAPPGNSLYNPWFVAKLLLFAAVACLSVYPSMVLLQLRNGPLMPRMQVSVWVLRAIWAELALLLLLAAIALVSPLA